MRGVGGGLQGGSHQAGLRCVCVVICEERAELFVT